MTYRVALFASVLLLAGCTSTSSSTTHPYQMTTDERLQNPIYAEAYAEHMVDRMTELFIQQNPLIEDDSKRRIAETTKDEWLARARTERARQKEGRLGNFVEVDEYARGPVILLDGILYFGLSFETEPGPGLHVFLTNALDPRDVEFPDETSVDLGLLLSPFDAQYYVVPPVEDSAPQLRTVVLWDTKLERLYGFAQLSK
ncbi:MAG: hypothetical protein WCX61_00510 [Candidatus Peribacteraceae bacterium]